MKKAVALPTTLAHKLAKRAAENQWMIQDLWLQEAVGIIGGLPKSYKSFLALAMGVSVASGKLCMGRFKPQQQGDVLVFCAEDSLFDVRSRLAAIASAAGANFEKLPLHVITSPTVRIDLEGDRDALEASILAIKPKLLVLDPFVRLHRVDENKSGEVSPLLGYLRELQRRHHIAVVLVHHAKRAGKKLRGGERLRGSGDLHAWGDSNCYVERTSKGTETLDLEVEHRNAPAIHGLTLKPIKVGDNVALTVVEDSRDDSEMPPAPPDHKQQILEELVRAKKPIPATVLRKRLRIRNTTLMALLIDLCKEKVIHKKGRGYELVPVPVPARP